LLRDLDKNTPADQPDKKILARAIVFIKEVNVHVNERKRQMEKMGSIRRFTSKLFGKGVEVQSQREAKDADEMIRVQQSILRYPGTALVRRGRRLCHQAVVYQFKSGTFSSSTKTCNLFLFSDLLLWTNEKNKFKGEVSLWECRFVQVDGGGGGGEAGSPGTEPGATGLAFVVGTFDRSGNKEILVSFQVKSEQDLRDWIVFISQAITDLKEQLKGKKKNKRKV